MTPEYHDAIKAVHDNRARAIMIFILSNIAAAVVVAAIYGLSQWEYPTFFATCQNVAGGDVCTISPQ